MYSYAEGVNTFQKVDSEGEAERRASAAGRQLRQRQVVDERHADSGPLQALVGLRWSEHQATCHRGLR